VRDRKYGTTLRIAGLTIAALFCFAANSLLCRMALGSGAIDAANFTFVRLVSGAVVLALITRAAKVPATARRSGSWRAALSLFGYAIAFSLAYLRLSTGTGALILFGCVQLTMIGADALRGQRPRELEWLGVALAFAGLVALSLPGATAPDPLGALLMAIAGVAWGSYSLLGRGSVHALAATADNFARAVPMVALAGVIATATTRTHGSPGGIALAVASGAVASGLGYSVWYAALPGLPGVRAAVVQLAVPVLAALSGVVVLDERLSLRLCTAGAVVLTGVALALAARQR
jgi:drug/metabolite transporter (DMT)-like permease